MNNKTFSQEWIKTFDGSAHQDDRVMSSVTDKQGNIYVTGYATRTGSGIDFCTIKYSSSGSTLWTSYYDGPAHIDDKAFGMVIDQAGQNIYVTGYSTTQTGNKDLTTIKYNASSGSQLYINRFGDPSNDEDEAFGIAVDRVNNVYVTGYITRSGLGKDIYTVKYNPNLVFIWQNVYNGSGNAEDRSFGIVTDSLGLNIYITGYATDNNDGKDMVTIDYDSSGTTKWLKTFNGSLNEDDKSFGIAIDTYQSGGIYITGYSTNSTSGADYTTIKYSPSSGSIKWIAKNSGPGNHSDNAFGIAVDNSGYSYVTGTSAGTNGLNDYLTIKYDRTGDTVWARRFNGSGNGNDSATSLVLSNSKDFLYVSGSSIGGADLPTGKEEIATVKYDVLTGEQIQSAKINMPSNERDVCSKLVVDTSNNLFIAGYTETQATGMDFISAKYLRGELIGVINISTSVPSEYSLYQNYPNPFNPSTKIRFSVPNPASGSGKVSAQIVVYDILGRQTALLVNEALTPGTYETDWDASKVSSGVYFYTLYSSGVRITKSMIVTK